MVNILRRVRPVSGGNAHVTIASPKGGPRQGQGRWRLGFLAVLLGAILTACTYQGRIEEPATIKLTWYSYLGGDDIRRTCEPGAAPRYRFVYNGHYDEQLRSYEVAGADGGGADFKARVLGPSRAQVVLSHPFDIMDPWRWIVSESRLDPADFADLVAALEQSGVDGPQPVLKLLSTEFYWVASGCRDGRFLFNAWRYGTPRFEALRFPEVLLGYDETQVALNPPRPVDPADRVGVARPIGAHSNDRAKPFVLTVGRDGVRNRWSLF